MKQILFICSGNYYRSRLAEILFNHEARTAGVACEAQSRGLLRVGEIKGLSPYAVRYLKERELETLAENPRDPLTLDVEDLTDANLVIVLNRSEHQPMIEQKFASLAKALQKAGRLRYWNVYDLPGRPPALVRLMGGAHGSPAQPADSGTEHIALAVKDLVREMSQAPSDI